MKRLIIFMIMAVLCVGFTGCAHNSDPADDLDGTYIAVHENGHFID